MEIMRKAARQLLIPIPLMVLAVLAVTGGCDRQDNDWSLYDADLKLVNIPTDTISLDEAGGEVQLAVTIGMTPDDTVFVHPACRDSQLDFWPDSIFFAPVDNDWLQPRLITVRALEDDVDEGPHTDELTFTVRSRDPAYDGQGLDLAIPVILADNDLAAVAVSETLLTLVESDLGAVFESYRLALQSRPTAPVTVTATAVPEEPSLHLDPASVVFTPDNWNLEQEITLWVELDGVDFDYQSLLIEHAGDSADSNYGPGLAIAPVRLEIFDDTLPPTAVITAVTPGDTVSEAAGSYQVAVSISRPSLIPVAVHLATADGTALGGADFDALSQDVVFQPGDPLTRTFAVTIHDDATLEYTEDFEVVITPVSGGVIGAADRIRVHIADNDVVALSLTTQPVDEDTGAAQFTVSLPGPTQFPVTFTFTTSDGTAVAGEDYQFVSQVFVLEPGASTRAIPVVLLADDVYEPDETFSASLSDISGNAVWTEPPAVCTIVNDDPQNIFLDDVIHHEADGAAVFTIELLRPYPHNVNLTVSTLNGDGLGGATDEADALSGSDFTPVVGGTWTIPAGATSSTFTVPLTNDLHAEASLEYFRLQITGATEPGFTGLTATCTLIDDHQPCIAVADVSVSESGGSATFTLELRDAAGMSVTSSADVLLQVDTMDQTATGGEDYDAISAQYTIAQGQPSVDVTVAVNDDLHDDDNETFILLITDPVNALGNCDGEPPFCTIEDDEFPSINLQAVATSLNEGSVFTFQVALTTQRQTPTTFDLTLLSGTSGGEGVDYDFSQNGSQVIPPFTDSITFTVPFLDDQLAGEGDESIEATIANANCALGVVSLPAAIIDAPELSITGDSVLEGETAWFTVTADAPSTADISFMVQHSSGTAVGGADYDDGNHGPFTIPAGQASIQVPVITFAGDGGDAAVEDFYLTIVNPVNATNSPFNSTTGFITDTDPPELTWDGTAAAVEGDDIIFTVNLSWASSADVQFGLVFTDGTAARLGIDYDDADTGPFTVTPGNLSYQVAVPTTADGLPELAAEDFTVTLVSPVNATVGAPSFTTGYVLDGDQPELSFQLDQSAAEGGTLTFTAQLSQATTVPVEFSIEYDNGSTQGAADFDAGNTGPFTIPAGGTTASVTVDTVDDAVLEGVESFIIRIAGPVNAVLGAGFEASGTIIDND
jgi:hypothetical protein